MAGLAWGGSAVPVALDVGRRWALEWLVRCGGCVANVLT